jgi:hypothetical protein
MSDHSFGPLEPDHVYHLFNRGNNRQDVFFEATCLNGRFNERKCTRWPTLNS